MPTRDDATSTDETIEGALETVRDVLGMDAAYIAEFADGRQVFRAVEGDAESFGLAAGDAIPQEGTYCLRMLDGSVPNVVADAAADDELRDLPITESAGIGSYASVPLRFPGGHRGTLCCVSHAADPTLVDRDIKFMHVVARLVEDRLARQQADREARMLLDGELVEQTAELRTAMSRLNVASMESVLLLSKAVEFRDDDTGSHTARVGRYASELAQAAGMDALFCEQLLAAAALHDAGKVGIPDAVLLKPGRLTDDERALIETHAAIGHSLLRGSSSAVLTLAASIAHTHHERYDGSGYPRGLAGERIPIEGRITAIADVFDALSSDRVYRAALPRATVVDILQEGRGSHFDPALLDLFLARLPDAGPSR